MNDIKLACSIAPWGGAGIIPAMTAIGNAGFSGIECPAGTIARYEDRLQVFEEILEKMKLALAGLMQPILLTDKAKADEQVERAVNAARFAASAGQGYIIVCQNESISKPPDEDGWITAAAVLEEVGRRCHAGGVTLCYMPVAKSLGMGEKAVDRLLAMTPPEVVHLALDTAEVFAAGLDCARLVARHAARLKVVRYRDAPAPRRKTAGGKPAPAPAIGKGTVKFDLVGKALLDISYTGWLTLDVTGHAQNPKMAVEDGYGYLLRRAGLLMW